MWHTLSEFFKNSFGFVILEHNLGYDTEIIHVLTISTCGINHLCILLSIISLHV